MNTLIYIFHISLISFISYKLYQDSGGIRLFFIPSLVIKLLSGLGIGWLYIHYYPFGDTWTYFNEASLLADIAYNDVTAYFHYLVSSPTTIFESLFIKQPRALFFTKIVSVFSILTAGNYWLIACYFSLFTFTASWILAKQLVRRYPNNAIGIIFSICFFPSAVFWTSGVIKESLSMGFIYLIAYCIVDWSFNKRFKLTSLIVFVVSSVILWKLKYYIAAGLLSIGVTILISILLIEKTSLSKRGYKAIAGLFVVLLAGSFVLIGLIKPNIGYTNILHPIVINNHLSVENSNAGDYILYNNLNETWGSVIRNSPKAFFSGLLRPFVWEVSANPFKIIYSIENLILFALIGLRIYKCPQYISKINLIYVFGIVIFTCVMMTFLALSTPNYGTLVRYKSSILPFVVLLLTINQPYFQKLNGLSIWKGRLNE